MPLGGGAARRLFSRSDCSLLSDTVCSFGLRRVTKNKRSNTSNSECCWVIRKPCSAHSNHLCCACSRTESSPSTLLAAMNLKEVVVVSSASHAIREGYVQSSVPAAEATHAFGLNARHAKEVLSVGKVGGQLSQLRVQLCLGSVEG